MKKSILIITAIAMAATLTSCKKKVKGCMDPISINYNSEAEEDDGSCQYAGTGGNTAIAAFPQHHGVPINGQAMYVDTAYVKFNTENMPSSYDLVIAGDSGEEHVHIPGLKPGKYYIYMTGYDTSGIYKGTPVGRVSGGVPYTLTQTSGEVDLNVPVTE